MYIIVVGAGKVGYYLVKTLLAEGHEVLVSVQNKEGVPTFQRGDRVRLAWDIRDCTSIVVAK